MGRFIYSVRDIFDTDHQKGCLGQHNCCAFLIDSYQRGYKWDSEEGNWESSAPVNTLFRDIADAMQKDKNSQYYLQFINVKENDKGNERYLEVIDGQQRLTTLSILAAVLKNNDLDDFAGKKIRYCCRSENEKLLDKFHSDLSQEIPLPGSEKEDQTNWFFLKAYQTFQSLVTRLEDKNIELKDFYNYLANNVFIIVNVVRSTVRSEDIFNNLNSRKVFLTNVELIKGLLLSKAVRNEEVSYRELLERRTLCGRQWDEMTRWLNNPAVGAFFFETTKRSCYDFILLVVAEIYKIGNELIKDLYSAAEEEFKPDVKRYKLFNLIYSKIRNAVEANHFFNSLCDIYWCLHDIYDDIARHNEIGFILFPKQGTDRILALRKIISNHNGCNISLIQELFDDKLDASVEEFIKNYKYSYRNTPQKLRRDLMLINCFRLKDQEEFITNDSCAFPFHEVSHGDPDNHGKMNSLEHIFPQNPFISPDEEDYQKEPSELFDKYTTLKCANLIEEMAIPEDNEIACEYEKSVQQGENALKNFYEQYTASADEVRKRLHNFYAALTLAHKNLFARTYEKKYSYLDSIGNVVLLLGGENTTVSNFNFAKKRSLIREMINNGRPIPAHTFDAFSKIGGDMNKMECWQLCDVENNETFTLSKVYELRKALQKKVASVMQ